MQSKKIDEQLALNATVCRTCLSACRQMVALESQLPIASSTAERKSHRECLRACLQQEVPLVAAGIKGVALPALICLRCSKALQVAYHFITLACESERTLRTRAAVALTRGRGLHQKIESVGIELQQSDCEYVEHEPSTAGGGQQQSVIRNETKVKAAMISQPIEFGAQFKNFVRNYVVTEPKNVEVLSSMEQQGVSNLAAAALSKKFSTEDPACSKSETSECEQKFVENITNFEEGQKYYDSLDGVNDLNFEIEEEVNGNCPVVNAAKELDFSKITSSIIEEFKENISSVTRDLTLVRNKCTTLQETRELQKALESKEAEVQNSELVCVQCNKCFTDMHAFILHRNRHKGITPFRCNLCNYFTCYSESLRKHYNREHDIVADNKMLNLRIEPNVTPTEKPYYEVTFKCQACSFQAHSQTKMRAHIRKCHLVLDEESAYCTTIFNCPDCYRTFKEQKSMRTHFTLVHGASMGIRRVSTETFVCEHCKKQFNFKASLVSHQRVCRLREGVGCNFCNKKFATVRQFERHLRAEHNVETLHECEVCGKIFNNADSLSMHRKRHSERHFQCEVCPRNYANSSELKAHVQRMHSTETKALCLVCGASFTNLGSLRDHENREHFKKYFKCTYCDYQCTSRCSLRIHEFTHTGKPYKCGVCGKEYSLRAILRRHAKNTHGINITDEELAAMFRKKFGYPSRYDAFSKANNSLEITEVREEDIELELQEYGLKFDDIVNDLFANDAGDDMLCLSQ